MTPLLIEEDLDRAGTIREEMLATLPPHFASDDIVQRIYYALGKEFAFCEERLQSIFEQGFPSTADDGLETWERALKLPPNDPVSSIESRRAQVIGVLMSLLTASSGITWQAQISAVLGSSWSYVEHDPDDPDGPPPYTVWITSSLFADTVLGQRFAVFVRSITPANLAIVLLSGDGFVLDVDALDIGVL